MFKKVEALANVAVIVTSVIVCSVLVKKYVFLTAKSQVSIPTSTSSGLSAPRTRSIPAGTKISFPGADWSKSSRTIVLALSTTCHFCSDSAPFYQRLAQEKPANVGLVAVLPQSLQDSRNYLNKLNIRTSDVVQSPLSQMGVQATPTLLIVDSNGSLIASWVGKLSDNEAARVIERIRE